MFCRWAPLWAALLALGTVCRAEEPARPNVLFIAIDDLRPELGCYGKDYIKSPNIDGLAATGLRFDRAYCQYAICGPSRASILTGLRPDTLKIEEIDTFFRNTVPDVVTLPQYFKQHGYIATYFGKVFHRGQTDDDISWSPRLKDFPVGERPGGGEYQLPESIAIVKQRRIESQRKNIHDKNSLEALNTGPAWEAADQPDNAYVDGRVADDAIAALQELKGKPFFLGVGFHKPHLPFVAPKKYFDLYDPATLPLTDSPDPPVGAPTIALHSSFELRARAGMPKSGPIDAATSRQLIHGYAACVSFIDAQIGRVLAELDRLHLRDNTIIVLWGDHGWHLGEYGIWGKATDFEVATRVPLLVCAPEAIAKGKSTRALVEFVDVYPSLCELAGLPIPSGLSGKSFVPLLSQPDLPWKEAAFSQFPAPALREWAARPLTPAMRQIFFGPLVAGVEEKLKQEHGARYDQQLFEHDVMGYSVRTDRYRYTEWIDRRHPDAAPLAIELYDHAQDPREQSNVANQPENADVLPRLHRQLRAGCGISGTPSPDPSISSTNLRP